MPPVILWALGAVGAAVVGRWLCEGIAPHQCRAASRAAAPARNATARKLERDPQTGVYRPK